MKKIIYSIYTLVLILAFSACSDSVLDKDSIGRYNADNYLTTDEEAKLAIIGVYDYLSIAYNNYEDWSSAFFVKILPGDDLNAGGGSSSDQPKLQQINNFTLGSDNACITDVWHSLYRIVNSSNQIINNISTDISTADTIIAEAKFFRAFAYFELTTMWGDIPYYTELPEGELSVELPRIAQSEVYSNIETDLKEAISVLPLKSEWPSLQKYRISKGATQALLGKVYLYQGKYELSHQIFNEVITSDEYGLTADYSTIWKKEERAGIESLFEVMYTSTNDHDWGGPWDGTAESNFMIQLMGPRGDNSFNNLDVIGYTNGWGFNVPTKKIGDLLNAEAGAVRAITSVISEEDFVAAGGEVNTSGNFNWSSYEGFIRLKYSTIPSETGGSVSEVNWNTPFKLIRYADVLLMAAEAYNRDNNDASAVELIKLVRERAGFTDHSAWESLTGDDLFDIIKKERSLELAFEGHRFWDLVRWGDAATELSDLGFEAGKHEVYPIPLREITLNPGISADDQNSGY